MRTRLSPDLGINEARLAETLLWPKNLGIQFRRIPLATRPAVAALLISVDGLSSPDGISTHILKPLAELRGSPGPADLSRAITVGGQQSACHYDPVTEAVLAGYAALLVDGWEQALLLDVVAPTQHHAGQMGYDPHDELFARDLRVNVALIRKRLRDPGLRAFSVDLQRPRAGGVALLYLEGKSSEAVVRAIRRWAYVHVGEEAASRGLMQAAGAALGLLPRFNALRWADQAATLLDSGYVLLFIDGMHYAYTAPVTHAAWLACASDYGLLYPLKRWLARIRILFELLVLILPATVVAVFNYHQEMIPVGFLLAVASARENAPFGILFEALGAELLVEAGREAAFRLPIAVPIGLMLVGTILILLMAVQTGFIGPVPALTAAVGAVLSLSSSSNESGYLVRIWRFYLMLGAAIMGYFGIAAFLSVLLTYLHQASSWGVPFFGPSGWELSGPEGSSSRRSAMERREPIVKGHGSVR